MGLLVDPVLSDILAKTDSINKYAIYSDLMLTTGNPFYG